MKFKVWSNFFFLIPLAISGYFEIINHAILIAVVMFFSLIFHLNNEKKWKRLDQIFAISLMVFNLYLFYLASFKQPHFLLAIFCVLAAFSFYLTQKKTNYDRNHGMWHVWSAMITLLCVVAYTG